MKCYTFSHPIFGHYSTEAYCVESAKRKICSHLIDEKRDLKPANVFTEEFGAAIYNELKEVAISSLVY